MNLDVRKVSCKTRLNLAAWEFLNTLILKANLGFIGSEYAL